MLDGHHKAPEPADLTLTGPQRSLKKRMLTVLEHLEAGHSRASAAAAAGVGVSRVKQWYQHGLTKVTHPLYPWFRQELERSEGSGESIFANIVIREATETHHWRAAMFILQKRYKWNDRPALDSEIQEEQQRAQLAKTKADTVYVETRTEKMKEDSEALVLDRLRDILDEVREEVKKDGKPEAVN